MLFSKTMGIRIISARKATPTQRKEYDPFRLRAGDDLSD
jgi:uncharacterized DUF497 family protein